MPHTRFDHLVPFIGFIAWGDVYEVTVYRNKRGKMVWFPKTYPDKPASPAQLVQRQRMTDAAAAWQALSAALRAQWHLAARRASLVMHGYDLFIHWKLTGDDSAIATLDRQTRTPLFPP